MFSVLWVCSDLGSFYFARSGVSGFQEPTQGGEQLNPCKAALEYALRFPTLTRYILYHLTLVPEQLSWHPHCTPLHRKHLATTFLPWPTPFTESKSGSQPRWLHGQSFAECLLTHSGRSTPPGTPLMSSPETQARPHSRATVHEAPKCQTRLSSWATSTGWSWCWPRHVLVGKVDSIDSLKLISNYFLSFSVLLINLHFLNLVFILY